MPIFMIRSMRATPAEKHALTLIEMLVVLAIIALLTAIIVPAQHAVRAHAAASVCLSNLRQLTLAWLMYNDDHHGLIVGGSTYYSEDYCPTPYRWVEVPLFNDTDNPEKDPVPDPEQYSNAYRLNGIRAGKLFGYCQDESVYHCPADRTSVKQPEPFAAWRSYSIAGLMNGEDFVDREGDMYTPIANYAYIETPQGQQTLICVTRESQIRSPSEKYVFVEEAIAGSEYFTLGSFVLMGQLVRESWWNWPAAFHSNSGTLGFSDGHAENRKWIDARTRAIINNPDTEPADALQPNNPDLEWMVNGYIPRP